MQPAAAKAWMKENRTPWTQISIWLPREGKSRRLATMLQSLYS